jgi:GSH-dependent disulfide-bond oxidoreductase
MNMTLYHGEPNGPSLTVLATLIEKGLTADLISLDLAHLDRHGPNCERGVEVDMSIEGEGPVLVVDGPNGKDAMADSVFIACFLDDFGTGPKLRPDDAYARWEVMMWCRQIIERLAPAAAFLGCKAHLHGKLHAMVDGVFDGMASRIHSEDLRARWHAVHDGNFSDEQLADSTAKIIQAVEKCEARLEGRDWLMGDFSLADLETYAWLAGMVELVPQAFTAARRTTAWLDRVSTRPSVQRALSIATVHDPRQSWAPGPEINRWG